MAATFARLAPAGKVLVLLAEGDANVQRATNNLANVKVLRAGYVNMRDLFDYDTLVITQDALPVLEGVLS